MRGDLLALSSPDARCHYCAALRYFLGRGWPSFRLLLRGRAGVLARLGWPLRPLHLPLWARRPIPGANPPLAGREGAAPGARAGAVRLRARRTVTPPVRSRGRGARRWASHRRGLGRRRAGQVLGAGGGMGAGRQGLSGGLARSPTRTPVRQRRCYPLGTGSRSTGQRLPATRLRYREHRPVENSRTPERVAARPPTPPGAHPSCADLEQWRPRSCWLARRSSRVARRLSRAAAPTPWCGKLAVRS